MALLIGIAVASSIASIVILILFRFYSNSVPVPKSDKRDKSAKRAKQLTERIVVSDGIRGEPRTCPICAARFEHGENVRSKRFPAVEGKEERTLHILGCIYCADGERERLCPVCKATLTVDEWLTAKIFSREDKDHVHIVGCNHCRLKY
jgi:hypothetical protein